jgi:hypothetical protein
MDQEDYNEDPAPGSQNIEVMGGNFLPEGS